MHLAGRIIFAVALMVLSAGHFTATEAIAGYAASKRTPAPKAAVVFSGLVMWTGAILIALGWHRFIGAGLVILFFIPVTVKMHDYWNDTDPSIKAINRVNFWKNVGLAGAALFVAAYGWAEWPLSLGG
jgi:uncharacterized membrane protein YphA (DoxX/SURF4 family)